MRFRIQNTLLCSILALLATTSQAQHLVLVSEFITNSKGEILGGFDQDGAKDECARRGLRLPTIRELLEEAIRRNTGAAILEVKDYVADRLPIGFSKDDFYLVEALNPGNKVDRFYYSLKNFKSPSARFRDWLFWSDSQNLKDQTYYDFSLGNRGWIFHGSRDHLAFPYTALCVGLVVSVTGKGRQ